MHTPQREDPAPVNTSRETAGEAQDAGDAPAEPEKLPETEDFPLWLHSGG